MDQSRVLGLIDELSDKIDTLESSLEPLIEDGAVNKHAESLPLLDRAKLYATTAYTIESLLYNHLSLAGEDAKNHPVMTELNRVKQYFEKIRDAEDPNRNKRPEGEELLQDFSFLPFWLEYVNIRLTSPGLSLDKNAAQRFIKHALSGNEQYDIERANQKKKFLYPGDERTKAKIAYLKKTGEIDQYIILDTPDAQSEPGSNDVESEANEPSSIAGDNIATKKTDRKAKSNRPPKSSKEALDALLDRSVKSASNAQADEQYYQREERKRQKRREKKERRRQRKNEMKKGNSANLNEDGDSNGT